MDRQAIYERVLSAKIGAITGKTPQSFVHDNTVYRNAPTFAEFKTQFWREYEHAPHQQAIDEKLLEVVKYLKTGGKEGIGRLMIFMPPRHGKTLTISRLFPAWLLSQRPDDKIIMASYGAKLATRNSKFVRNLIASDRYQKEFPHVAVSEDTAAANEWTIKSHDGGILAVGVGTGVTGSGAQLVIVDDPVRSRADAESETYRQRTKDWYMDDLSTRLEEPGGALIIMQTRWHQDDLSGWLLRENNEDWTVLNLPAIAGKNDPIGRHEGAALWPARYPLEKLRKRQAEMGDYSFAALYQQSPIPGQGGLFKREKFNIIANAPADIVRKVRFWDLALSSKTSADYTVGVEMGITSTRRLVVLDVSYNQVEWDEVEPIIAAQAVIDGDKVQLGVESAFYQTRAVTKLMRRSELHNFVVRGIKPDADKFTRALPFAARVGEGMVDLLQRSWTDRFVASLCSFPYGVHDDDIDGASGAYLMLDKYNTIEASVRRYA